MNNPKPYLQDRLKKLKSAAAGWIHNEEDDSAESTMVELEPEYYERCRKLAEAERTTVTAVVHFLLEQQLLHRTEHRRFEPNQELIEKNPLLALDAITRRREQSEPGVADIEQF